VCISEGGVIVDSNEQLLKMFGLERAEMVGHPILEFVAGESRAVVERAVREGHETAYEHCLLRKDGSVFYAEAQAKVVHDEGRTLRMTALRDITARKQAEEMRERLEAQLRQSQKLEAIGTLAGGIAHDFNNILGAIISYTELTRLENARDGRIQRNLGEVLSASQRAAALVQQVLTFSRKQPQKRASIDLAPVVREALSLLRSTLPRTIELEARLGDGLPAVLADPTQVHQIVVNLCTNASHAMRGRQGTITVALSAHAQATGARAQAELQPGEYLVLSVQDSGHGMSEETLQRVFEPFFTTKGPGEGSGLGLAVVHGIVEDHGGTVSVESRLDEGTCVHVFLPCTTQPVAVAEPQRDGARGSGERIIFVDDEPVLCAATTALLSRLGFQPTALTSSDDAWHAFNQTPDAFDLVITDLTMPRMTGIELARRIQRVRPGLPILLTSGFPSQLNDDALRDLGVRGLLLKPVDHSALLTGIQRALGPS
jgi:PAS domain S-box-containing protein